MSRVDELIDEMKAEESRPATPAEEVKETPAAEETVETKDGGGAQEPATADVEVNDTKSSEERGTPDKGNADEDVLSRAEFSFKRKLEKMNQKHAAEIAERDRKYEEMKKEFEELKKTVAPKDPVKGRKDFETDDEYIDYLTQRRVEAIMAERDGKDAERREKEAEEARKQKEAEAEIAEQQQKWLNHVDRSFGDDKARAQKFLSKIQYANRNGLGEILDACPVAADFLMNQPNGPKVFERLLDDSATFRRVFSESASPLDIYYELRNVERELSAQAPSDGAAPSTATNRPSMPHIGKPGKQAGAGTKPDIFSDKDAMLSFIRR